MDEPLKPAESDVPATETERVRAATERLTELFEHAPIGICILTAGGDVVACNPAFARLFGFASIAEAAAVNTASLWVDAGGREQFLAELRRSRRLEPYRTTLRAVDGRLVHVLLSAVGHFESDGTLAEIRAYLSDDTANVEADRAMHEREQLFRAVFFDASDAILLIDDRRAITDANPAAASLFGRDAERLVGVTLDHLMAEPVDTWRAVWRELIGLGEAKREHQVSRPDGSRIVECIYRARIRAGRHLCIARDITDRRLLDERLAQAARIESVGRLAGGIAHDFNNLLTSVLGFTELLLANHPAGDPERDDLEEIQRAGKRASLLTKQLLAFGRRQVMQPQQLDLNRTIGGIQSMLRRVLREDIALTIDLASTPAVVMIDPGQIEQVLVNLVLNSRDALPTGGAINIQLSTVTLSSVDLPAEHRVPPGPYVRLRVTDDGSGISPEVRTHLFEPFFTTKEQGKGTGLGLASVYGIVHQSGGFIDVENPSRGGTVFTLYFPAIAPAAIEVEAPVLSGRETILLVEDEEPVRTVVGALLRRNGYMVLEAATPQIAYQMFALHASEIALLLTDVVMPGMNGPALAQRCVAEKATLRVLFISSYADAATTAKVTGPNIGFLGKPFPVASLTKAIRDLLDRVS
jgi:PAS domain S-box-containing protein